MDEVTGGPTADGKDGVEEPEEEEEVNTAQK